MILTIMLDKKIAPSPGNITLIIGTYLSLKIAFKYLFLPTQIPSVMFDSALSFSPAQLANFAFLATLTAIWWAAVVTAISKFTEVISATKAQDITHIFLPQTWLILACEPLNFFIKIPSSYAIKFWPITPADILAAAILSLSAASYILKKTGSQNRMLTALPILITIPLILTIIPPQAAALIVYILVFARQNDLKTARSNTSLLSIFLFFLGMVLYRHNLAGYAWENILPLTLSLTACLNLSHLFTDSDEATYRHACAAFFCATCVGTPILILTLAALSLFFLDRSFGQIFRKNFWVKNILAALGANLLILSGWAFAKGELAEYPKIFMGYTCLFFPFFLNSLVLKNDCDKVTLSINALGCILGLMVLPQLLLIDYLHWITIPAGITLAAAHFMQDYAARIKLSAMITVLAAVMIALTFL